MDLKNIHAALDSFFFFFFFFQILQLVNGSAHTKNNFFKSRK